MLLLLTMYVVATAVVVILGGGAMNRTNLETWFMSPLSPMCLAFLCPSGVVTVSHHRNSTRSSQFVANLVLFDTVKVTNRHVLQLLSLLFGDARVDHS